MKRTGIPKALSDCAVSELPFLGVPWMLMYIDIPRRLICINASADLTANVVKVVFRSET